MKHHRTAEVSCCECLDSHVTLTHLISASVETLRLWYLMKEILSLIEINVIMTMFKLWDYIPHFFHALSLKSYHAGSSWDCDCNVNEICSLTPMLRWFLLFQGVIFDLRTPACSATVSDTITSTRTHLHLLKGEEIWSVLFLSPRHLNNCRGELLRVDALWCGNTQMMQEHRQPRPLSGFLNYAIKRNDAELKAKTQMSSTDLQRQDLITGD